MFFELFNVSANFMNYIHEILRKYLNIFVIIYVDDIFIFSASQKKHDEHVRLILNRLKQYNLFVKLNKCQFDAEKITFLNYIIEMNDISMNENRIKIITE